MTPAGQLHGWKEIATYLGRSVRTAQRWERALGLPIQRIHTEKGEIVFANGSELDDWQRRMVEEGQERGRLHHVPRRPDESGVVPAGASDSDPSGVNEPGFATAGMIGAPYLALGAVLIGALATIIGFRFDRGPEFDSVSNLALQTSNTQDCRDRVGLDSGPWPTFGHDTCRSNQSHLSGPRDPGDPVRVYTDGDENVEPGEGRRVRLMAVGSGNHVVIGRCGSILAIAPTGALLWETALKGEPHLERPTGVALLASGSIAFTSTACSGTERFVSSHVYELSRTGEPLSHIRQPATYFGPAVGSDGTRYIVDASNTVRAFTATGELRWINDLPGFNHNALAVNGISQIYVGTDGSAFNQDSLWSLTPDGRVHWSVQAGSLNTPAISPMNRVHVAEVEGTVLTYDSEGQHLWSYRGTGSTSRLPLAVGTSGNVYLRTSPELAALSPDGEVRWRYQTDVAEATIAAPVLDVDENVIVSAGDTVSSLTSDGRLLWERTVPDAGRILIGESGLLYVASGLNAIFAIPDLPSSE